MGDVTPQPRRVTMAEVAAAAQVSVPTVSKVLNGRSDVAPDTRSRVEAVFDQYGYRRTAAPRQKRSSGLIDLVFSDLSPWSMEIVRGAEHAALESRHRVGVAVASDHAEVSRWLSSLATSRTDGVILVLTELADEHRERLAELKTPVVIIDPIGKPDPSMPSIGASNWAGALDAANHLIELGHRRIATITGRPNVLCSQARLGGYRAALEQAGIPVDPDLVAVGDFRYESALAAASALLELDDPPTAIFAASDVQAMGVYEAARQHQLRLPDELSVVGFDDVPMARWMAPPLTTVRQPLQEMAALAVRMLLADSAANFNQRAELATNLVVRSSTTAPAS